MNLTLRQLRIFTTLAHQLHFGRTAEELGLSQPVVSQELRRLEDMLPGVLFSRSTRLVQGGDPDLGPETAHSYGVGGVIRPRDSPTIPFIRSSNCVPYCQPIFV